MAAEENGDTNGEKIEKMNMEQLQKEVQHTLSSKC